MKKNLMINSNTYVTKCLCAGLPGNILSIYTMLPLLFFFVNELTALLEFTDLEKTRKEKDALRTEVIHWKTQAETSTTDAQREKKVIRCFNSFYARRIATIVPDCLDSLLAHHV